MTKPICVVPADDPVMIAGSPHLGRLAELAEVCVFRNFPDSVDEQLRRAADAELMISSRSHLNWPEDILRELPRLKMITTCSIGVDSIDLDAASRQGIVVSNVPGRTAQVVAEHALALMLGIARRLAFSTSEMKAGRFRAPDNTVMRGKTLGVIGTGSIGYEMIRLGQAIGMKVQAWTFNPTEDRARELLVSFVKLDELLSTSDVISIHVKLTDESRGMLSARELGLMRPGSLLVNAARGPVVDSKALVAALDRGHLGGAALDVYDIEPLPANDPILSCQHVILTPHTADQNDEGRDMLNGGAVDNIIAFLEGKPQNVVNS